jgi:hypothetical protein
LTGDGSREVRNESYRKVNVEGHRVDYTLLNVQAS